MVEEALRAADEMLSGVWKDRMKGILSGATCNSSILQWNDDFMCVGDVVTMGLNQLVIHPWKFSVGEGFRPEMLKTELTVAMVSHLPFKQDVTKGETIVCMGNGWLQGNNTLCLQKNVYIIPRPEMIDAMPWNMTHLFCGAYGGWTQAIDWLAKKEQLVSAQSEIFIDQDEQVMRTWMENHRQTYERLPLTKVKVWYAEKKLGLLGSVGDRTIMYAIDSRANHVTTMSPPCVTWSKGGKGAGLQSEHGWAFVEAVFQSLQMQTNAICMECADEFRSHPHAVLVEKILTLFGYKRVWEQVVSFHLLSDSSRNRWLAVWVRSDVCAFPVDANFTLRACPRMPWTDPEYDFDLPDSMTEQLQLCPSEAIKYADPKFLPPAKRARLQSQPEPEQVLEARMPDLTAPLPTLCAMYTSQHMLNDAHLANRGIYAAIVKRDKRFCFLDPIRWISMLGASTTVKMPSKIQVAFHHIGNAIATQHALLAVSVLLQSISKSKVHITNIVTKSWNQRHTATTSVVLAGTEYWTVIKLADLPMYCPDPKQQSDWSLHDALANLQVVIRNPMKTGQHPVLAPEHWSVTQFLLQVMQIDHHLIKRIRIASRSGHVNTHTTLAMLASKKHEWSIKIKSQEIATLVFPCDEPDEDEIAATLPFRVWEEQECSHSKTIDLKVPTFGEIMESPSFARFLAIIDQFHLGTTVLTPSDAKQTVTIGIAESSYATKVPIKMGNHFEQIKQIAQQLHPENQQIKIVVPPVPLQNPSRFPAYLVQASPAAKNHVFVFLQKANIANSTVVAQVPVAIRSDARLIIQGRECILRYHNDSLIKRDTVIETKTADVLTLLQITQQPGAKVFSGGHPDAEVDIALPAMAGFQSRCEYAMNTEGWMAVDELHFALSHAFASSDNHVAYRGIAVWNSQTNEILESGFGELQDIGLGRTNLPIFCKHHWSGLELDIRPTSAQAIALGFRSEELPQIADALARFLDLQPRDVEIIAADWTPVGHMCGWQLAERWCKPQPRSGIHSTSRQNHRKLTQDEKEMIDDVIKASHKKCGTKPRMTVLWKK